jgi:hypothetical protein
MGGKGWRKLSAEQVDEIVRRSLAGEGTTSLAEAFGASVVTIRRALRESGVEAKPGKGIPIKWGDETVKELGRRWVEGEASTSELAAEMGVSISGLYSTLRKAGFAAPGRSYAPRIGRRVTEQGYVVVRVDDDDPMVSMRTKSEYIPEHRLVMARHLGRPLEPFEYVHHRDGDRANNALANLQLVLSQPKGAAPRCRCCQSMDIEWVAI